MRLVDGLVAQFPQSIIRDPYLLFPFGQTVQVAPLLDYLIGGVAWLLGAGAPSQGLIDTVGAFTPAVLGALIPLPVFFWGAGCSLATRLLWAR